METTTANTSKEMSAFSDFPPDESHAVFMRNAEMLQYIHEYAEHHGLCKHIRFRHMVTLVERADDYGTTGKWTLHYEDDNGIQHIESFEAVLVCHGNQRPLREGTERPNWQQFSGRILHACEVKNTHGFKGKTNVIIGFKPSATDIAVELSRVSKKVYLSTRSGGFALTRCSHANGRPLDMIVGCRFNKYILSRILPSAFQDRLFKQQFLANFNHEKCGLALMTEPLMKRGVTISDELAGRIMCGAIEIRPDIAEYTPNGVLWTDGTSSDHIDNVIFATGYVTETKLVENGKLIPSEADGVHIFLYENIFPSQLADHNTLGFICAQYIFGPLMPTFEMMSRCFFEQFAGVSRLPSKAQMTRIVERERHDAIERAQRKGKPLRLEVLRETITYWDELAKLIGCQPHVWRTFLTDPRLAWALLFGPNTSYAYRLRGPHAWPPAREVILDLERRVDFPLAHNRPRFIEADNPPSSYNSTLKRALKIGLVLGAGASIVLGVIAKFHFS